MEKHNPGAADRDTSLTQASRLFADQRTDAGFAAALERFIEEAGQGGVREGKELRRARRQCGRWLALRQLEAGLSSTEILKATGIDEGGQRLLLLGLATEREMSRASRERLGELLCSASGNLDQVMAMLEGALGMRDEWLKQLVEEGGPGAGTPAQEGLERLAVDLALDREDRAGE